MEKIKYDYSKLKGRIREYFGTNKAFAESLNLSEQSIYNKLSEDTTNTFTQDEIFYCIQRLNIKPEELIEIFFKEKV